MNKKGVNKDRISMSDLSETQRKTILRMHHGTWGIQTLRSYLSSMLGMDLSDEAVRRLLMEMEGKQEFEHIEAANREHRALMVQDGAQYENRDRTAHHYQIAGRAAQWAD